MARTQVIADAKGGVAVPLTVAEEDQADQREVDRAASQPGRDVEAKSRLKAAMYDKHGATVPAILEALVENEEGRPGKFDALKAARVDAKADPDWPA